MDLRDNTLKAWLSFNTSPTEDARGNSWQVYGNPTIGTANAVNGKALQLDGQSYIKLSGLQLGGQDFCVEGWVYVDSASPDKARLVSISNSATGCVLVAIRKSATDASKLEFWVNSYTDVSQDNGFTVTSTTTSIGQRVFFRLIYSYSNKTMRLDINASGSWVSRANLPKFNRQSFDVYIGSDQSFTQGLIGSIDELCIYDGGYPTTSNPLPTAEDYQNITFAVDIERQVQNEGFNFRYENYGTADLLSTSGTTLTNLPVSRSVTGSAFYQTTRAKCFDIPATPEIWVKFDVYTTLTTRWRAYNGGSNGATGITAQTTGRLSFFSNSTNAGNFEEVVKNQLQTVLLHMVSGATSGIIEAWIDGNFIYQYTGNVNNGADFADIYLQSDGSGTYFSNVIISNNRIGFDEGYFNFAVDIERKIENSIQFTANVVRFLNTLTVTEDGDGSFYQRFSYNWKAYLFGGGYIGTGELCFAQFGLTPYEPFHIKVPARREIWLSIGIFPLNAQTISIFTGEEENATGLEVRRITDQTFYDLAELSSLVNGVSEDIPWENTGAFDEVNADSIFVLLHFNVDKGTLEIRYGDQRYKDSCNLLGYDISPRVIRNGVINDGEPITDIWVRYTGEKCGAYNALGHIFNVIASDREIALDGTWSVALKFDIVRDVYCSINFTVDLVREVILTLDFTCDLIKKTPHKLIITPINPAAPPEENPQVLRANKLLKSAPMLRVLSAEEGGDEEGDGEGEEEAQFDTKGVQSITIELTPQQITDRLSFTWINPANIMEDIVGQYLDYKFNMRIEELTKQGILITLHCCSDIDEILYTPMSYIIGSDYYVVYKGDAKKQTLEQMYPGWEAPDIEDEEIKKAYAETHIKKIAGTLGKEPILLFSNFVSSMEVQQTNVTYADLISNLFGWTSRIPNMMINCYIRDDKLYAVQRGMEQNEIDLTEAKHTTPIISKKIMRTTWGSSPNEEFTLNKLNPGHIMHVPPPEVSEDGKTHYTYERVYPYGYLLMQTITKNEDGSKVTTNYEYTETKPYTLVGERSITRNKEGKETDNRYVQHNYLTPSQTHSIWFEEDNPEGSVVGSHVAGFYDETVTLHETTTDTKTVTLAGNTLIDASFPVVDQNTLIELAQEIRKLNRQIQETVSMDIYGFPHVIDFNDRIIFEGKEYSLESNTVTKTPRIVNKQSVTLIRWHGSDDDEGESEEGAGSGGESGEGAGSGGESGEGAGSGGESGEGAGSVPWVDP